MHVKVVQKDINDKNYQKYLQSVSGESVDLVCLGELSNSGCLYNKVEIEPFETIIDSLKNFGFSVMLGYPHLRSDKIYNSYIYYEQGNYEIYDKINLFKPMNEPDVYQGGKDLKIFKTKYGSISALICYDLRFPDLFSQLKKMGAETIFVPAAWPIVRISDWKELLVKRAIDNEVNIVGINAVGDDGTNQFGGSSMIVNSKGKILALADKKNHQIIEAIL